MDDRRQAILELIAAQLEIHRADRALKQCVTRVSIPTAYRVLHRQDHKISTLIDVADALGCDVQITITKRAG